MVRQQARLTLAATVTIGLGVIAAAPLLLGLFGPDFGASLPILAILVAGSVAASVFGPGEDLLTMLGGERLCAVITLVMVALAGSLCVLLIPRIGVTGAAVAMAATTAFRGLAMALAARAIHGLADPGFAGLFRKARP